MLSGVDRMGGIQRARMIAKRKKSIQVAKRLGDTRPIEQLPCDTTQMQRRSARERFAYNSSSSDGSFDALAPQYIGPVETLLDQVDAGRNPHVRHLEREMDKDYKPMIAPRNRNDPAIRGTLRDPPVPTFNDEDLTFA